MIAQECNMYVKKDKKFWVCKCNSYLIYSFYLQELYEELEKQRPKMFRLASEIEEKDTDSISKSVWKFSNMLLICKSVLKFSNMLLLWKSVWKFSYMLLLGIDVAGTFRL